jgi:hypothetical protein
MNGRRASRCFSAGVPRTATAEVSGQAKAGRLKGAGGRVYMRSVSGEYCGRKKPYFCMFRSKQNVVNLLVSNLL